MESLPYVLFCFKPIGNIYRVFEKFLSVKLNRVDPKYFILDYRLVCEDLNRVYITLL